MTAFLFPGQGAQFRGMGRELFARYPALVDQASQVLGYSLATLCLDDPNKELIQTQFTQPAVYVVNWLTYLAHVETTGQRPAYALGHSLGEYNALCAAGAFDWLVGLRLVQQRGALMAQVQHGGLLAVIGLTPYQVRRVIESPELMAFDIANFNSYEQTVVAGPSTLLESATTIFEAAHAERAVPLKVSAPFHSRYMRETEAAFGQVLSGQQFAPLQFPVISNYRAEPYADDQIATLLTRQITGPVRWIESIEYLLRQGVREFVEVGPGTVLTKLVQQIRSRTAFAS